MKAMAVLPSELKAAGRMPGNQLLRGRIVDVQTEGNVFRCYLLCGDSYKEMIGIEAWAEVANSAHQACAAGDVVQCSKATIAKIQPSKRKFTHSQCGYFIRYDRNTVMGQVRRQGASGDVEVREMHKRGFGECSCLRPDICRKTT